MKKNYSISATNEALIVTGITDQPLNIDTTGDIELNALVTELTKLIDEDIMLEESSFPDSLNDKQQLVLDTLRQIIVAYNNCLNPTETTEDTEIISVDVSSESDDNQDLPF